MDAGLRSIMEDCFDGAIERQCDNCPNHPGAGGTCCFGTRHDYKDSECQQCNHRPECATIMRGFAPQPRPPYQNGVPSGYQPQPQRPTRLPMYGQAPRPIQPTQPIRVPVQSAPQRPLLPSHNVQSLQRAQTLDLERPFIERLGQITVWGMIEGGLQMALDYFQMNRPR